MEKILSINRQSDEKEKIFSECRIIGEALKRMGVEHSVKKESIDPDTAGRIPWKRTVPRSKKPIVTQQRKLAKEASLLTRRSRLASSRCASRVSKKKSVLNS